MGDPELDKLPPLSKKQWNQKVGEQPPSSQHHTRICPAEDDADGTPTGARPGPPIDPSQLANPDRFNASHTTTGNGKFTPDPG